MKRYFLAAALLCVVGFFSASAAFSQYSGHPIGNRSDKTKAVASVPGQRPQLTPHYIENKGQWDKHVKFLLHANGMDMWITDQGVVYDLHKETLRSSSGQSIIGDRLDASLTKGGISSSSLRALSRDSTYERRGHVVRMQFEGALAPTVMGTHPQKGIFNYLLGSDSSKWVRKVHTYGGATAQNLYKGIDAVFYLDNGAPRYDLVLQPGADPSQVRMTFAGQQSIRASKNKGLKIQTSLGCIEQRDLLAYQRGQDGSKQVVKCSFKVGKNGKVNFDLGKYDRAKQLVIDPIVWSTLVGGEHGENIVALGLDSNGCSYFTGYSDNWDNTFPTTVGAYKEVNNVYYDPALIGKFSSSGDELLFATFFGSDDYNALVSTTAIAVDKNSQPCVTGRAAFGHHPYRDLPNVDVSIPTTSGVYAQSLPGNPNYWGGYYTYGSFLTKFSSDGSDLVFSTYFGGRDASFTLNLL